VITAGVLVQGHSSSSGVPAVSGPVLRSLTVDAAVTELAEGSETVPEVRGVYSDGRVRELFSGVVWHVSAPGVLGVRGQTLVAGKEGTARVTAEAGGKRSAPVTVTVYKEINGHRLPPEPDPKVNNATLLGVDVNHNDVRDDVERWIYEHYKDKHPIHIDIAMQAARAKQHMLRNPDKAKLIHDEMVAPLICESYYRIYAKYFDEKIIVHEKINTKVFRNLILNTSNRQKAYAEYDALLSGDIYKTPKVDRNMSSYCDFNTSIY